MAVTISLSITQNSQNITNNTSNVTVKATAQWTYGSYNATGQCTGSITIDGTKHSFTGIKFNTGKTTSGSQVVMTKTVDIKHNDNGTKELKCSASFVTGVSSGTITASASKDLTTIPRKSTLSVGNGTLNTEQTLTVTRKSSNFTHSIKATCGSASVFIKADGSTSTSEVKHNDCSISFIPPLSWASQNTTGTSVSVKYIITTYNGSSSIGSNTYTKTCSIPPRVKPSCSVAVTDPTGYATKYGGYIKGLSKFNVVVTPTIAYGSAIDSYSVTANGSTYTKASFTTGVISSYGILTVEATVKDKRERTGTSGKALTVFDYAAPKISKLSVARCNQDGTANEKGEYAKVTFSGSVTSLNNNNSATYNSAKYTVSFKKSSASSYTTITSSNCVNSFVDYTGNYSVSNGSYIFAAETGSSYDVKLSIKDDFKTTSKNTSVSTAFTMFHFSAGGTGLGIGKIIEEENLLDIGLPVRLRSGIVQDVLWSGNYYMTAGHTATLSKKVSEQPSGIVLVFSSYANGTANNYHFSCHYVPKQQVLNHAGLGHNFFMVSNPMFEKIACKYLYISDDKIVGNANNSDKGTMNGITFDNTYFVLRYVIGV